MQKIDMDVLMFFDKHQAALPLYIAFRDKVLQYFPDVKIRVQKTQITYSNRHVFACVSFIKVKKKMDLPEPYIVVTLGLSAPIESDRIAVKTEPYPGRWTHHIVVGTESELDEELFLWIKSAYDFAENK